MPHSPDAMKLLLNSQFNGIYKQVPASVNNLHSFFYKAVLKKHLYSSHLSAVYLFLHFSCKKPKEELHETIVPFKYWQELSLLHHVVLH